MRTEDDVRHALDLDIDHRALARLNRLAAELGPAPVDDLGPMPVDELGAPRVERTAPRRRLAPLLAAAAVVLVAVGGLVVVQSRSGSQTARGGGRLSAEQRRPVWNVRVAPLRGYVVTRVSASSIGRASGSTLVVTATNPQRPVQGVLTTCPQVHCADTTIRPNVTVHGRPGRFNPGGRVAGSTGQPGRGRAWAAALAHPVGLSWYAGHSTTVFLTGTFGFDPATGRYDNAVAKRVMLRIADAVSAGHRDPTRLPFVLSHLPHRVAPEQVRIEHAGACGGYGTGPRGADDPLGLVLTACRVPTGATRAATVAAADRVESNPTNGRTRFEPDHPLVRDLGDGTSLVLALDPTRHGVVTAAQVRAAVRGAEVSPRLDDPSTWPVVR